MNEVTRRAPQSRALVCHNGANNMLIKLNEEQSPRALVLFAVWLSLSAFSCSTTSSGGDASSSGDAGTTSDAAGTTMPNDLTDAGGADAGDVSLNEVGADGGAPQGPPPSILPVSYTRTDEGTPLSVAELQAATDEIIAILKDTRYFAFVDERVHGWPETDPNHGYWWGAFWTGITVTKSNTGTVTYKHPNTGSDNAGIHTAPYLESSCYAHLLWGEPRTAHLVRRMARGFSSWTLAMERFAGDGSPRLLSRTFYPPSMTSTEGGRSLFVDTSANRPGLESAASGYVHHPTNPYFGDIYVKVKRSKDDIGHMLRAIAQSQACTPRFDANAKADMAQLQALYEEWTADVDSRGFQIATRDTSGNVYVPNLDLAKYNLTGNLECVGALALRLFHGNSAGNLDCGNGLGGLESTLWTQLSDDVRQIMRTHHAAATRLALEKSPATLGLALLQGLGDRVSLDYGYSTASSPPANYDVQDVAGFMAYAARLACRSSRPKCDSSTSAFIKRTSVCGIPPTLRPTTFSTRPCQPGTTRTPRPTLGSITSTLGYFLAPAPPPTETQRAARCSIANAS
jgi:hypothetical protein